MAIDYTVTPGGPLRGTVTVPGDKSISHRAVMLAALAEGRSTITTLLEGEDVLSTITAFRALGVTIEGPDHGRLVVTGVGLNGLRSPMGTLDLGNSGTSMRLMAGLLSGQVFPTILSGDASLIRRPMERVAAPLRLMGAQITTTTGCPPLHIGVARGLRGIQYALPVASAQVKSAILLAGLYATGETTVIEPAPSRDHTERMLEGFGYPVRRAGRAVTIRGGGHLRAATLAVPGDLSSAAFFLVAASVTPGSVLVLPRVGVNPSRTGVIDILRAMGARITYRNATVVSGEPVADLEVEAAPLHGITIDPALVPLAIDEFPALFIAAACATGTTVLRGAAELRVKESDRLAVMATGLRQLGIRVEEFADGLAVTGGVRDGGKVDSHGDHRIAMAFAIAGHGAQAPVAVADCRNVATSFPGFDGLARSVGLRIAMGPP
ncbi:MAG: 3-phosphoshikimate 1-carboxyvinyltransferase [Acidiferrobacter sp.]